MLSMFSSAYVVENLALNVLGAQVVRYLLAKWVWQARGLLFTWPNADGTAELKKNGLLILNDFLPEEAYTTVRREFDEASRFGTPTPIVDGSTVVERYTFGPQDICRLPTIDSEIVRSPRLRDIIESAEHRRFSLAQIWCDSVRHGDPSAGADSQKELHTDNYFTTHKVWYFLDDVPLSSGPLMVATGTHRFSFRRLLFEYAMSVRYKTRDNYAWRARGRWPGFLKARLTACGVPGNTLVVANTHAFHQRGDAEPGSTRRQIHMRFRHEPFGHILHEAGDISEYVPAIAKRFME